MLKDSLKQQVIQGAEDVEMAALSFHKQDVQFRSTNEQQLIPYAGWVPKFALCIVYAPFWAICLYALYSFRLNLLGRFVGVAFPSLGSIGSVYPCACSLCDHVHGFVLCC